MSSSSSFRRFCGKHRYIFVTPHTNSQLGILQVGGYCVALSGLYLFDRTASGHIAAALKTRNLLSYIAIISILWYSTFTYPLIAPKLHQVGTGHSALPGLNHIISEPSHIALPHVAIKMPPPPPPPPEYPVTIHPTTEPEPAIEIPPPPEPPIPQMQGLLPPSLDEIWEDKETTPLSNYLRRGGIGPNRTLFVTMASRKYIEPMINFKYSLDRWNEGQNYVVLCLDIECVEAGRTHGIHVFDGYLQTIAEAQGDWHSPVARMKVSCHQYNVDNSLRRTSILLMEDIILSCSMVTSISQAHNTHSLECVNSPITPGTSNFKRIKRMRKPPTSTSGGIGLVPPPLFANSSSVPNNGGPIPPPPGINLS